jgi:hypothetical protein
MAEVRHNAIFNQRGIAVKDARSPGQVSLNNLISRLRDGRYVIPKFQRDFEWKPSDIRELMRSIFLDYYIGSLLLWAGQKGNFAALSCDHLYGFDGEEHPEHIVLDGQQRLTALYYVFFVPPKPLPNRKNRYFFHVRVDRFMAEEYDAAFEYEWAPSWSKFLENTDAQYEAHIFPLSVLGKGGFALANWVQGYEKYWQTRRTDAQTRGDDDAARAARLHTENANAFGQHLQSLTEQYQISYIELDRQMSIDKVCDIFTQINSRGVQLDTFDLINALLSPKNLELKKMWHAAAPRLEFVDTEKMNTYILQVMSVLRQGYCSPKYLYFLVPGQEKSIREPDGTRRKEILIRDIGEFKERWDHAVDSLGQAIKLLSHPQEFGAISSNYLPYVAILPAFAALQSEVAALRDGQRLEAQRKVRHWYWASVFLNRYSGSVESTTARDFLDIKAWIYDDASEPPLIEEFKSHFGEIDLHKELKRGTSIYNGIFNLLVIQGARDWETGNVPQHDNLDDHHIIPASKASELGAGNLIHSVLNRTPLTAQTNRHVISDRWPSEYLPQLMQQNGETLVRSVLESHCISPEALVILLRRPLSQSDYREFIDERKRTIFDAIENLLIKQRLDLPPRLRELDQRIERVELELRKYIADALDGDISRLPPHINQKIEERLAAAAKKNGISSVYFATLSSRLEYSDLSELQETILNKSLWPGFESRFASKGALQAKFAQLTELRNSIRHSRSVNEINRKEGEAAILWFEQLLGLSNEPHGIGSR